MCHSHSRLIFEPENNLDPDDGNSKLCGACRLPIFSTRFTTTVDDHNNRTMLHNQCANDLPATLGDYPLHLWEALHRRNQQPQDSTHSCSRCHEVCGSVFYQCDDENCRFQLDVACAVNIKIVHRSHPHRLTPVRWDAYFICSVCKTDHDQSLDELGLRVPQMFYVCTTCSFWVHPDCALLPNAIVIDQHHPHPLLLTYNPVELGIPRFDDQVCAICHDRSKCIGFYLCVGCSYYAHSKCAITHPHKQVLLRDAQFSNMLRLPLADEHASVMRYVSEGRANTSSSAGDHTAFTSSHGDKNLFIDEKIHEHPLIFHDDNDDHRSILVCNACIGPISSSDPFYRCTNNESCGDFFLHSYCAHLPATSSNKWHLDKDDDGTPHPLSLISKVNLNDFNIFQCYSCERQCNGFAYACKKCDFYLDVVCASMPALITHEAHGRAHILHQQGWTFFASCCGGYCLSYKCTNCHGPDLHASCAQLPDTVTHKFDRHPLKLITKVPRVIGSDQDQLLCEICEEDIDHRYWHYSCGQCDQSFHIKCIPFLDKLSKIKFGFTIHVRCHDCSLACVRALTVDGYRCGHCQEIIREVDELAFECSKCYFRIHKNCAKEVMIKS